MHRLSLIDMGADMIEDICGGTIEQQRRKAKSKEKRSKQRRAQASPFVISHKLKPTLLRTHGVNAQPITTELVTKDLPHTHGAYTGGRDPSVSRRVFTLDELVGEQSTFGFDLIAWDGRCG